MNIYTAICISFLLSTTGISAQEATIFVSPAGDDLNDGKTAPVRTVTEAIRRAISGNGPDEVIELAEGTYDAVTLEGTFSTVPATWSKNLVIQGAPGIVATLGGITTNQPRMTFRYLTLEGGGVRIDKHADFVHMENIVVKGRSGLTCIGADSVVWYRCHATDSFNVAADKIRFGGDDLDEVPKGMLIEECYFRGSDITGSDGNHIDNIQMIGGDGLYFKNCVIWNAPTGVVMTGPATNTSYLANITWDGCYIGNGSFYTSATTYDNVVIRNCILNTGPRYSDVAGTRGDIWENNRILYWSEGFAWPSHFTGNTVKVTGWNASKPTTRAVPDGNTKDPDLVLERPVIPEPMLNPGTGDVRRSHSFVNVPLTFVNPVRSVRDIQVVPGVEARLMSLDGGRSVFLNSSTVDQVPGMYVLQAGGVMQRVTILP